MTPPRLPAEDVGVACVEAALRAAARLHEARSGGGAPGFAPGEADPGQPLGAAAFGRAEGRPEEPLVAAVDRGEVRAALVSERLFRVGGEPAGATFAPASRFWRAADGWVRTHANFPWHREALLRAVGATDEDALAGAIAARGAQEVEAAAFAAGGVAAKVRSPAEWLAHPQGAAVAAEPLVDHARLGDAPARGWKLRPSRSFQPRNPAAAPEPAAGVRVLDFTRVIAGPVCSRYLGALGADVLRLDLPSRPDGEPGAPADTLLGKRSAFLDLGSDDGAARLEALLADADVVLLGYRPGALSRFGLAPEDLAERHPGLVVMELAAWGHTGPWRERRGFDSIVQAASGIAAVEADPDGTPGALPCQLLDLGTGYLAAAAVLDALVEHGESGGTHLLRLSLARTAHWLLSERPAGIDPVESAPPARRSEEDGAAFAARVPGDPSIVAVPPPGSLGGAPLVWPGPAARYGAAAPAWRDPPAPGS